MDVVYPLYGDATNEGELTSGYLMGEPPINRPLERHPKSDGGGISSVVRIRGTMIALAGRVQGRSLHVFVSKAPMGPTLRVSMRVSEHVGTGDTTKRLKKV